MGLYVFGGEDGGLGALHGLSSVKRGSLYQDEWRVSDGGNRDV